MLNGRVVGYQGGDEQGQHPHARWEGAAMYIGLGTLIIIIILLIIFL